MNILIYIYLWTCLHCVFKIIYMPQLIIIPYNHVYITILIILFIGLLNYYKILIPLILYNIKFNIKFKLNLILKILNLINVLNIFSKHNDMYFNTIYYYLYNIDLNIIQIIDYFYKKNYKPIKIINFIINNIIFSHINSK